MHSLVRRLSLFLAAGALLPAAPVAAVTQSATVNANVVKPLELVRVQDLDLGSVSLTPGNWSATVAISQAGLLSCANPNMICTGAVQPAKYFVSGTNKMVVLIHASNVSLVNQADPTKTLTLVPDAPPQVTLPNSGQPGITFSIGGSVTLTGSTASGDYIGTFNVTAEYQ